MQQHLLTLSGRGARRGAPFKAHATVPKPYSWDAAADERRHSSDGCRRTAARIEILRARFERFEMVATSTGSGNKRAVLMTRARSLPASDRAVIYDVNYHDIGFGVTITGPRGRTDDKLDRRQDGRESVEMYRVRLSVGLSLEPDRQGGPIEIIKPLAERTRGFTTLIQQGYTEYKAISSKCADGYYGWEQEHSTRSSSPAASITSRRRPAAAQAKQAR
jgi:protein-L-isoaspartate(D-aspartate) O-methyltransferase